jgi:hypothetical protein
MSTKDDEEQLLRSVAEQNAHWQGAGDESNHFAGVRYLRAAGQKGVCGAWVRTRWLLLLFAPGLGGIRLLRVPVEHRRSSA